MWLASVKTLRLEMETSASAAFSASHMMPSLTRLRIRYPVTGGCGSQRQTVGQTTKKTLCENSPAQPTPTNHQPPISSSTPVEQRLWRRRPRWPGRSRRWRWPSRCAGDRLLQEVCRARSEGVACPLFRHRSAVDTIDSNKYEYEYRHST